MKKIGLNEVAFNICVRKLLVKQFIEISDTCDYHGNEYRGIEFKGVQYMAKNATAKVAQVLQPKAKFEVIEGIHLRLKEKCVRIVGQYGFG